jgi:hypothetical protein
MRHQVCSGLGLLASMPVGVELLLLTGASDIAAAYSSSCYTSPYERRQVQAFIVGCTGRQTLSCWSAGKGWCLSSTHAFLFAPHARSFALLRSMQDLHGAATSIRVTSWTGATGCSRCWAVAAMASPTRYTRSEPVDAGTISHVSMPTEQGGCCKESCFVWHTALHTHYRYERSVPAVPAGHSAYVAALMRHPAHGWNCVNGSGVSQLYVRVH